MKKLLVLLLSVLMICTLSACGSSSTADEEPVEDETFTFTVAMECAYAPYNWTQTDDSNGAVPISGSSDYANGYDIMIAKKIAEYNGWDLEVIRSDWDSLVPAVTTGQIDAAIAGQSMTAERSEVVDFAGPYYYATFAILVKADSDLVNATSIQDFAGYRGTAQLETIWYDECLPQMTDAIMVEATADAPTMLMELATNVVDFVVTDWPTATGALVAYDDFVVLDFTGTDGDFVFSDQEREENVNIGISVQKGNTELFDAINAALADMSVEDMNELMEYAISIQPVGE